MSQDQYLFQPIAVFENHAQEARYTEQRDTMPTVSTWYGTGGNNQPLVIHKAYSTSHGGFHLLMSEEKVGGVMATDYKDPPIAIYCMATGQANAEITDGGVGVTLTTVAEKPIVVTVDEKCGQTYVHENSANTLAARDFKQPQVVVMDRAAYNQGANAKYDFCAQVGGAAPTVIAKGPGAVCCPKWLALSAEGTTKALETNMSKKGK